MNLAVKENTDAPQEKVIQKGDYSIRVNTSDYQHFWDSFSDNSWERETFKILDRFTTPNHIYLDIGAWIGPTVLYGAQNARQVFAIEPDLKAYNELVSNIGLNSAIKDKIVARNIAITEKTGDFKLFTENFTADSTSTLLSTKEGKDYYIVKGVSFQELAKEFPLQDVNLIKIDVEGSEYALMASICDVLRNLPKRPTLYISLHPPFLTKKYPSNKILRELLRIRRKLKIRYSAKKLNEKLGFYKYFYDINGNVIHDRKSLCKINDFHSIVVSDEEW